LTVDQYCSARSGNLSPKTLKSHRAALNQIFRRMELKDGEPTPRDVREWLIWAKENKKPSTVSQECSIVRAYFKTMGLEGRDRIEEIFEMMKPKAPISRMERGFLSKGEVGSILECAKQPFDLSFSLGYCYARRLGEIRRLENGDITPYDTIIFLIEKKGKR